MVSFFLVNLYVWSWLCFSGSMACQRVVVMGSYVDWRAEKNW